VVRTLLNALVENGAEAIVVEIADGLLQEETAQLLETPLCREMKAGVVFAARDALAAIEGERRLLERGYDVRAISGIVSSSPLSTSEVSSSSRAPVFGLAELWDPEVATRLMGMQPRCHVSPEGRPWSPAAGGAGS